jgi:hypothetical protein
VHGHRDQFLQPFTIAAGSLWGGSSADRITQLRLMANGNLAAAGVTASPDFSAGGIAAAGLQGPTDAFVAIAVADLGSVSFVRLIGGSGDEEPLALDTNRFNELLIAGWTSSTDFPLVNPLQKQYGGGASDGFLLHLDSAGQPIWSSYYGGAGVDRVTYARFDDGQRIFIGGTSDSPDLVLNKALYSSNAGGLDGFYGTLVVPVIHADNVTAGKDLVAPGYARLGDTANHIGVPLTIASSDPASVLVAARAGDPGQASITVAVRAAANDLPGRAFLVYCLADSGSYRLTLTAPGYLARVVAAQCVPAVLAADHPEVVIRTGGNGIGQGGFGIALAAFAPSGRLLAQNPRPGLGPLQIDAASSDPSVVTLAQASATLDPDSGQPAAIHFSTSAIGSADVQLSTPSGLSFAPSDRVRVRVTGPAMSLFVPTLARDLVDRIGISFNPALSDTAAVTLSSSDPTKARLTTSNALPGSGSVTVNCSRSGCDSVYLELLDSAGPATITASAPGFDPVTAAVTFVSGTLSFFDNFYRPFGATAFIQPGTINGYLVLTPNTSAFNPNVPTPALRAGAAPIAVHLSTSDPSLAAIAQPDLLLGLSAPVSIAVKGGTSIVTPQATAAGSPYRGIPLTFSAPALALPSATVGKNLQRLIRVSLPPATQPIPITVTSSDPARLLVGGDSAHLGTASLSFTAQFGAAIYAQALADSGDVTLTASSPGFPDAVGTIHLAPAGLAWNTEAIAATTTDSPTAFLVAYALDPANLAPIESQSVLPGLDAAALQISTAGVVKLDSTSIALTPIEQPLAVPPPGLPVKLTPVAPGDTRIAIVEPPGFLAPAGRQPLRIAITPPPFALSAVTVGRSLQYPICATFPNGAADPAALPLATFTSTDPAKLLLSTSATDAGAASVATRRPADSASCFSGYQGVYAQAVDGPADVAVKASIPGYADATTNVQIVPTALVLATGQGLLGTPTINTTTQSDPVPVTLFAVSQQGGTPLVGSFSEIGALWPGFPLTPVTINSSNPDVAVVQKPALLNALTASAPFLVKPLAPGETELSISYPPGFVATPAGQGRTVKVVVSGAALALPDVTVGRDLVAALPVSVKSGVAIAPADFDAQFTSSDPAKVLLSATASSAGAASITVHFAAGQPIASTIYVHGLVDAGSASIRITAPGYTAASATVTLARTTFVADQTSLTVNLLSSSTLRLRPAPVGITGFFFTPAYQFRPGIAPFNLTATIANTAIATVSPAQSVVSAGISEIDLKLQPVAIGSTNLAISVPDPYLAPAAIPITVQGGFLAVNGPTILGKDLQAAFTLSSQTTVTVTSSDPSRLLVSASATQPGAASVVATQGTFYAQGLADSGSVTITVSASGFQIAPSPITLAPATVVFGSLPNLTGFSTISPPVSLPAQLTPAPFAQPQARRAGAGPLIVPITLSDAAVGSVTPAQLTFNPGDSIGSFNFQPKAAGAELITLAIPPGFGDPFSARELLLNVIAARFVLGVQPVGKDLQVNASATLVGAPAQAISVTLASADPARLEVGTPQSFTNSIGLSFSSVSNNATFRLAGLADLGSATLTATAPGLPATSFSVALQPSGFRFTTNSATVAAGATTTVQIQPSMLAPGGLTPVADGTIRSDIGGPVAVSVTSSDPSIVSVPATPIIFLGGDSAQRFTITGRSSGIATLTIAAPPGWSTPAGVSKMTVIVP